MIFKKFITDLISIIIIVKYFRVSFLIHFDFSNYLVKVFANNLFVVHTFMSKINSSN